MHAGYQRAVRPAQSVGREETKEKKNPEIIRAAPSLITECPPTSSKLFLLREDLQLSLSVQGQAHLEVFGTLPVLSHITNGQHSSHAAVGILL